MSAQTWSIIAIILFTMAGALFIAAIIMFFVMNIPSIIGDLSGRTLAKGIQNIRNENAYNNSMSAKAANRRNNPNRQFSIGNAYSKEKGYTVSSIAHASRRLDRNTMRGEKNPPKTSPGGTSEMLTPLPAASGKLRTPPAASGKLNAAPPKSKRTPALASVAAPKVDYANEYTQETSLLDNINNQYTQGTTVLNNVSDEYSQATTVLGNSPDEYSQATTVLGNSSDEYSQATTVLSNSPDEYSQATTVLSNSSDEYSQATTVLGNSPDEYLQATTVLGSSPNEYSQATTVLGNSPDEYTQATTLLGGDNNTGDSLLDSYYNEYTQGTTVLAGVPSDSNAPAVSSEQYKPVKPKANLPHGFRVVRKVSVTHCNEVL